jgi:DNA-binding XRE family transcriptional regulator
MTRIQDLRLLELDVEANWADVEEAYRCLMRRYSIGGLASYGLLRVEDRRRFLLMLQEAYQRLRTSANETFVDDSPRSQPSFPDLTPFSGSPETARALEEKEQGESRSASRFFSAEAESSAAEGSERSFKERHDPSAQSTQGRAVEKVAHPKAARDRQAEEPFPSLRPQSQAFRLVVPRSDVSMNTDAKSNAPMNTDAKPGAPMNTGIKQIVSSKADVGSSASSKADVRLSEQVQTEEVQTLWNGPFSGERLRQIREERSISLEKVAQRCGVSKEYIAALEAEHYGMLGASRQVRAVLTTYARVMDVEARKVLIDYLASYWGWRTK